MRARSIKPGICDNEVLGTADPFCTLLFERLWLMADREGRLEDRPLRIKAQAFPYRDGLNVEPLLQWLHDHRFIVRYVASGVQFIQILTFLDHQKPHQNEKPSVIPPPPEPTTSDLGVPTSTTKVESASCQGSKDLALTPSSLNPSSLNPDSGLLTPDTPCVVPRMSVEQFDGLRSAYPMGTYRQSEWLLAERDVDYWLSEGHEWAELRGGVERYALQCEAGGRVGTNFVLSPSKFFARGPLPKFLEPYPLPAAARGTKPTKERWHPADWKPETAGTG